MPKRLLSIMDHKRDTEDDMSYLTQPRGAGKSWVFRMVTPLELVGRPNPWNGKPLGKEIKRGLGTRHAPTARKRRDILLGDIRRLAHELSDEARFDLVSALEWREGLKQAAQEAEDGDDPVLVGYEFALHDTVALAAQRGVKPSSLKRFHRVALAKGFPLAFAHRQYISARREGNPYGFAPLKRTTVMSVDAAVRHLRNFLQDENETACLEDITPEVARRFRDEYLPSVANPRSARGLSSQTITKQINLLKQIWLWAIEVGHLAGKATQNPWEFPKGLRRSESAYEQVRQDYTPAEFSKLLCATQRGSKEGGLIRLAIATGCRADELASLPADQVRADGSGFYLLQGKTKNAKRFIPVVAAAHDLLKARMAANSSSARLFPEWPIRPASGKAAAVSQWFTRFRRKQLGNETDGRLALHSTRHTWRTAARRAGVNESTINDLGGWAGPRSSSSVYDHGLLEEQLEEAQKAIWDELGRTGYLDGF